MNKVGPGQLTWLFFGFSGRISRQAYALAGLLLYLLRVYPIYRIINAGDDEAAATFWGGAFLLVVGATLISHVATSVKRLHDMNQPGWFAVFFIIGDILMYLFLCLAPGTRGPNRFGAQTNAPK
nr:DUF805 domain-containing protein [Nitratireductor arenosus]